MLSLLEEHEIRVPYEQEIQKLTAEITRLTEALKTFADESVWGYEACEIAQKALKQATEEER